MITKRKGSFSHRETKSLTYETGICWIENPFEYFTFCFPIYDSNVSISAHARCQTNLRCIIQILLPLYRTHTSVRKGVDLVYPLAATRPDISSDDQSKRCPVRFWERLAVHLPCQENFFILSYFAPRDGYSVVVYTPLSVEKIMEKSVRMQIEVSDEKGVTYLK